MKVSSGFAEAVPEFYLIVAVAVEKGSKEVYNGNGFTLTRVNVRGRGPFLQRGGSLGNS